MSDETVDEITEQTSPVSEAEARDYGWTAKEEFKGPAEKWRPADEYLQWAKQSGRLPKSEFDEFRRQFPAIRRENGELKAELGEVKQTLKEFVEFSSKAEQRAYERARKEIEAKIENAAANADQGAVRAGMAELDRLEKPHVAPEPKKTADVAPKVDPAIQDWLDKNQWYTRDKALNGYATEIYGELERSAPGMSTDERLAETRKLTIEKFPEKFGINPNRERAGSVAEPRGDTGSRKRGKTYDDLPADAKKACDKFVKQIPGFKREDYLRDYEWE